MTASNAALLKLKDFPFFPQLDNGPTGYRECQTSAIAMCLRYLQVRGIHDDLDYLRILKRYGDTTMQSAHNAALASLGVRARFRTNLNRATVTQQLRGGRPIAAGVLHKGPASQPQGGGHYIAVFGQTASGWIVNDPFGEMAVASGGYVRHGGNSGREQVYSFKNLNPRWFVEGDGSGWGWTFD